MDAPALTKTGLDRVVVFLRLLFALLGLAASAAVTHASTVATPTFSPVAGTYTSAQTVTITSTTSGASIRYTTNGSTPSATTGTIYSGPVAISTTTTLKAIAYETGFTNSAVASGTYSIKVVAPVFSPVAGTYTSPQTVTITSTTSGASIRYTTDGSTPSATAGTVYSGPVTISTTTTLKAIAYEVGLTNSSVTTGTYSIKVIAPVFSPAAGTYTSAQMVTITSATSGASFAYTTDGTTPTESGGTVTHGTPYSGPVSISANTMLKAIAYEAGLTDSAVTSGTYTIKVIAPVFSPAAGTYTSPQMVTMSSATSSASINYTTDGSTPSATVGTLYSGPVSISATTTLKAIAYKTGLSSSAVTTGAYTIKAVAPVFSPVAGTYTSAQSVTITSATSGASINYTTDGSTPSATAGTVYSGPVSVGATATLKAIAYETGLANSAVTSGTYTINLPPVAAPTFSPAAGTYTSVQMVAINSTTSSATIRYTTDGSTPSVTAGTIYSGPVSIGATTTLKAIAYETGFKASAVKSGIYTINLPTTAVPVFSPASGTYASVQSVTITSATSGALIRYTTDGSIPTETMGTLYSGPVSIGSTTTLQAIAYKSGYIDSAVTSGTYTITPPPVITSPLTITGQVGAAFSYQITASNGPASYNATGLPSGLNVDTSTGLITGTPTTVGTSDVTISASNPNGTGSATLVLTVNPEPVAFTVSPVSFIYNGSAQGPTIMPSVSGATYAISGTASTMSAGSYTVTATATGNYTGTSGPIAWTIAQATPVVSWATPSPIVYGTALDSTQLNATANVPGTFVYTPSAGTVLNVGMQTLSVAFTPTDVANYASASASVSLQVNPEPVTFTISPVSFTYNGSAQGPTITPSISGATYSISGTASATSAGSYTVTATATGNYTGTSGPTTWTIARATPMVSWATPAPIVYGTALDSTQLNATANVPGAFAYTPDVGAILGVGAQTLSVAFTPTDTTDYNNASASVSLTVNPPPAAAPVFSPAAGNYTNGQTVAITTTTSGATIRYTTDGSTPTETNGTIYSGSINIGVTTTLEAIAYESGYTDSAVTSGTYALQATAPVFNPVPGTFTSAQTVTITTMTNGATIRYTTDGSAPSETNGTVYSAPVSIGATTTLQAIAYETGFMDSAVTTGAYTINLPPTITPDNHSLTFGSSDNVSLSFDASDTGGSVSKVDLYRDGTLDSTLASPTSGSTWTFTEASTLPPGTYTYTGIAYNNFGGTTTSSPVTVTVLASLPYLTDFESSEGYLLGSLNQQLGWIVLQGSALVTDLDHFSGTQSTVLPPSVPPAQITQAFAPFVPPAGTPNIIFVDFYAKPVAEADVTTATTFNVGSARFAFVLSGGQGSLQAFNGNGSGGGSWTSTNFTTPLAAGNQSQTWIRLTARLDFTQGTWDLYANGAMVVSNLGFLDSTSTMPTSFSVQGDAVTASEIDDILAGTANPLFADVNNDGIDDAWETAHGLSLSVNERNLLSSSGNGSTILQNYINGTDPNDYYSGVLPLLTSLVDPRGVPGAQGLVSVKVTRASDGAPLANAPVTLAVTTGASTISTTTPPGSLTSVNVLTNSSGIAQAYVTFTGSTSDVLVATGQSGSQATSLSINIGLPSVAAPVFSPVAGTYTNTQSATITSATSGALVRYTTDGSTPTETNGTLYSGPVNIGATTTLNAIAYAAGFNDSPVTSGLYTINLPLPPLAPVFSITGGTYASAQSVAITSAGATSIYYTLDGSTPTASSNLYQWPLFISTTATLSAIGVNAGGSSPITQGTYTINISPAITAPPQITSLSLLHSFTGGGPYSGLIQGTDGRLYGTANQGGANGDGTIFSVNPDGTGFTTLYSFTNGIDGAFPAANLIQGTDDRLYGTVAYGGANSSGTVFAVNPDGTGFTTLYSFTGGNDGAGPQASLIQGTDGRLYGTTYGGGVNGNGSVFAIKTDGTGFTMLYSFIGGNDGNGPTASLIQGIDGRLYGTASSGGASNVGTLFAMNSDGTSFTTLYSFTGGADGGSPTVSLIQGADGRLYGTTGQGGVAGEGTVFAVNPDGTGFTTLYSFTGGNDGANTQASLIQGNDGRLYGTAFFGGSTGFGTVFAVNPDGASFATLYSFTGSNDGGNPQASLTKGTDGRLYGTALVGGVTNNGTLFAISNQDVIAGNSVTLTVTVTGTALLSYQWQYNGADIPGATSAALTLANVNPANDGSYTVVVSNAYGSATSATSTLTVIIPPPPSAPVFTPAVGTYTNAQSVAITSASAGATNIYYTTDGSTPTPFSTLYTGPVFISATTTLSAVGVNAGGSSPVTSGTYTINILPPTVLQPQTTSFSLLRGFTGGGGDSPYAGLIQGTDGRLYGMTLIGGANNNGSVFAMNADGTGFTALYSFTGNNDGANPRAGLIQGTDSRLYGTASYGGTNGNGTVFAINPDGTGFTTLYRFTGGADGATPQASLIQGTDGRLYGMASYGGANGNGTVFAINPDGTGFTTLYRFTGGADGANPQASLIQATDGRLYGTASYGGTNGNGTVFAIKTDGTGFTTLYRFTGGADGANPHASLIQATDDRLYGTASFGGVNSDGAVFAVNLDGTSFTTLYDFAGGNDGAYPYGGLIQGTDGRLYGTASGGGVNSNGAVFAINPDGSGFTAFYDFIGGNDGAAPQASLVQGTDGRLYGTAAYGGANGDGSVFAISSQGVNAGSTATLAVAATGTPPLSYQWQLNGVNIAGATGAAFVLTNVNASNDGSYTVVVGNAGGSVTSAAATLAVILPPPPSAPVFAPAAGAYLSAQSVSITSAGANSIYYTTDGSTPTTASTLYTTPVSISLTTTLSAIGVNFGGSSPVTSGTYTIPPLPTVALTAPIQGGQYAASTMITFSGTAVANASGTTITSVEFFNGTTALGTGTLDSDSTSSYTLVLPANTFLRGSYNISMTATDSNGASASTVPVTIQVSDYYNGRLPTLASLGESGPQGLVSVLVTNSSGDLMANAPLTLAVTTGASQISTTPGGTGATTILVHTNSDGLAQVYANFISPSPDVLTATAQSGTLITGISINIDPPPSSYIYTTDFETSEGYNLGSPDQQLGWSVTQGSATIASQNAFSGSQSVVLSAGQLPTQIIQTFSSAIGENIVYVDFYAKPVTGANPSTSINAATTFDIGGASFKLNTVYQVSYGDPETVDAFAGDGQGGGKWISTSFSLQFNPPSSWIRLTARLDYTHKTWDLYANGKMIAADLGLQDATSTQLSSFTVTGDTSIATELDALSVGTINPLFADANNDGIDDAWEQKYSLSLSVNDRSLDPAGNGQTVLQDYINGIDPTDYYGGQLPTLTVLNQAGQVNSDGSLSVRVTNASGTFLANAPVTFSTALGGSSIALTPGGTTLYSSVTVQSGANGTATVYLPGLQSPSAGSVAVNISAISGSNTQQQPLTVSPIPPAPVAKVLSEVIDQRINEYGETEFVDMADPGNPYRPGVYAESSSRYTLEGSGDENFYQNIIDPQTGHDTQTLLLGIPWPFGQLGPYSFEAYKVKASGFMVSPTEEKGIAYYYYYALPAPGYLIDKDITWSNLYPSNYLTAQMKNRTFDFTGTFVSADQSALLDYEPPITGPKNPRPPHYELAKMHYKLQVPPAAQQPNPGGTLMWFEVFTPAGTATPTRFLPMSCNLAAGQMEMPVYTLDPSDANHLNPSAASTDPSQNGTWQVVPVNITIQSYLNSSNTPNIQLPVWIGNAQPVCVGEPIKLTAQIDWPASMTNPPTAKYQWTLPQWNLLDGTTVGAIKDYNPDATQAPETDFVQGDSDLTKQPVTFYMPVVAPAGNNTVSCQVTINGVSTTITGTLTVVAPSINNPTTTSTVTASQLGPVTLSGPDSDGLWTLCDGDLHQDGSGKFIGNVGIAFDGHIVPSADFPFIGSTCFLQVLNQFSISFNRVPGTFVANERDNRFPYGEVAATPDYPADTGITADGLERKDSDSPQCAAKNPSDNEVQQRVNASMYYMWRPDINKIPKAIWVPLVKFDWNYYGEAEANGSNNVFTLSPNSSPFDPANPPQGIPTRPVTPIPAPIPPTPLTGEPTWNGIYRNPGGGP